MRAFDPGVYIDNPKMQMSGVASYVDGGQLSCACFAYLPPSAWETETFIAARSAWTSVPSTTLWGLP